MKKEESTKTLNQRLKEARLYRGLSQMAAALEMQCSLTTFRLYEQGANIPDVRKGLAEEFIAKAIPRRVSQ